MKHATAKAEETRERIVDTSLELFREKGFDETTMRDIAASAGVATGAAYYYFAVRANVVDAARRGPSHPLRSADDGWTPPPR